jgi:hypothetical protein
MSFLYDTWTNRYPPLRSSNTKDGALVSRPRSARFVAVATKELSEIVFATAVFSAILVLLAALDIWIWVPHLNR